MFNSTNSTGNITITGQKNFKRYSVAASSSKGVATTNADNLGYGVGNVLNRTVNYLTTSISKYFYPLDPKQQANMIRRNRDKKGIKSIYTQMDVFIDKALRNPKDPQHLKKIKQLVELHNHYFSTDTSSPSNIKKHRKLYVAQLIDRLAQSKHSKLKEDIIELLPILKQKFPDKIKDNNPETPNKKKKSAEQKNSFTFAHAQDTTRPEIATRAFERRAVNTMNGYEPEIQLNTKSWPKCPTIVPGNNSTYVVAWARPRGVRVGYYKDGHLLIPDIVDVPINVQLASPGACPTVAVRSDKYLLIGWENDGMDGSIQGISGRRIQPDCTLGNSTEFQVPTSTQGERSAPQAFSFTTGDGFAWQDAGGVKVKTYYLNGTVMADEFLAISNPANNYVLSNVVCYKSEECGFVVQTNEMWDASIIDVEIIRFFTNGTLIGFPIRVNDAGVESTHPYIAVSNKTAVIVWQVGEMSGIFKRSYSLPIWTPGPVEQIYKNDTCCYGGPIVLFQPNGEEVYFFHASGGRIFSRTRYNNGSLSAVTQVNAEVAETYIYSSARAVMLNNNAVSAVWAYDFKSGSKGGPPLVVNRVMSLPIKEYIPIVEVSKEPLIITEGQLTTTVDKLFIVPDTTALGRIEIIDSGSLRLEEPGGNVTTIITRQDIENHKPIKIISIPGTGKDSVIEFRTCDGNACSPPRILEITFGATNEQTPKWWMWVVGSISAGVIIVAGVGGTVCVCTHRQSETAQNRLTARKKHDARAEGLKIKGEDDLHDSRVNPHSYFQPSGAPGRGGCYDGKQLELQPAQTLTP